MTAPHPPPCALLAATDAAILRLCKETLTQLGFAVSNGLDSGAGAVIAARREHPTVILLSAQLSDVPAREAVTWLRANPALAQTPVIILGGRSEREADLYAPPAIVLPRPVTAAALKKSVADLLGAADGAQRKLL